MPQIKFEGRPVAPDVLTQFVASLLIAAGLRDADADLVARSLVHANLRGIDSHGVARLPHYLTRLKLGSINTRPNVTAERLSPSTARIDGDHALGQLAMQRATDEAIALARESGSGWAAVRNSSHCGALAWYGLQFARAGMIGFAFTHVGSIVLPYASKQPFCGTNPICITAPATGGKELCLDMATSIIPWNTVMNAQLEGGTLDEGWAVDGEGHPTTDANTAKSLHAIGAYKGSGLGMMIDMLCSMLTGSPFGPDIPLMYGDLTKRRLLGGLVGAIDISRFIAVDAFEQRVTEMMRRWNALPPADGFERVQYPGQPEQETAALREREGIPVGLNLIEQFDALARDYGLSETFTARLHA